MAVVGPGQAYELESSRRAILDRKWFSGLSERAGSW